MTVQEMTKQAIDSNKHLLFKRDGWREGFYIFLNEHRNYFEGPSERGGEPYSFFVSDLLAYDWFIYTLPERETENNHEV